MRVRRPRRPLPTPAICAAVASRCPSPRTLSQSDAVSKYLEVGRIELAAVIGSGRTAPTKPTQRFAFFRQIASAFFMNSTNISSINARVSRDALDGVPEL